MAQTARWIQRWLPCQSKFPLVHGDSPNPSSQDPPGEVLRHTGYFQGCLQLFIIPKLHFGQTGLLISLSCTWTFHHPSFCSGLLPLGMPHFKIRLNSTSSIEVFLPCLPQIISYLSEATPSISFINQLFCLSPIIIFKCHSHLLQLLNFALLINFLCICKFLEGKELFILSSHISGINNNTQQMSLFDLVHLLQQTQRLPTLCLPSKSQSKNQQNSDSVPLARALSSFINGAMILEFVFVFLLLLYNCQNVHSTLFCVFLNVCGVLLE